MFPGAWFVLAALLASSVSADIYKFNATSGKIGFAPNSKYRFYIPDKHCSGDIPSTLFGKLCKFPDALQISAEDSMPMTLSIDSAMTSTVVKRTASRLTSRCDGKVYIYVNVACPLYGSELASPAPPASLSLPWPSALRGSA